MNKEIEKMSDEDLIFKISDIWLDNYSIYKQELLKRLSKNKVEFEKDDIMLAQYFEKHIEYKEKAIEEYKKKLVEWIDKEYFRDSDKDGGYSRATLERLKEFINKIE